MKHRQLPYSFFTACVVVLCMTMCGCSTKKNTAGTRFWHSFTARYNTYFNGNEAYKTGLCEKEKSHNDNFTTRIPVFLVGNEQSRLTGKGQFETTITKCEKAIQLHSIKRRPQVKADKRRSPKMKAYLSRKEFNPFLKNAWLLMGRAQFQKGDFLEAASTFSYITRHYAAEPEVVAEARIWLARSYAQENWYYDAEDALGRLKNDSLAPRLRKEKDATTADLLLRQGRLQEALPYLKQTARKEKRKLQKARLYFLLGQVETELGHDAAAYKAYQKSLRQSPPYPMAFSARIKQTEVSAPGKGGKKAVAKLKRMARSANNKDFLDQVYYAMGNVYLMDADTLAAISAYEQGRAKSKKSGIEKGILLLRLGELYWERAEYDKAQACYGEAIGMIDKTYQGYEDISRRSKVLDRLVPHTSAIHLQDSLLALSVMSDDERNAAIDRVIEILKKKEEAERRARADSVADAAKAAGGGGNNATNKPTTDNQDAKTWFFYNPMMVAQGKEAFQKSWGRRKNEDNWRRSNRTVLASTDNDSEDDNTEEQTEEATDSASHSPEEKKTQEEADDPHKRAYYMAQIPFSEEAKAACHTIIQDALYEAGVIEKDQLEDFPLAARTLTRLERDYPQFERREDVLYQLFLLYSRWQKATEADHYRHLMATEYPESPTSRTINDPDYEYNARYGAAIEDSLYKATYEAWMAHNGAEVERNFAVSTNRFGTGANRPKFIFVHALSRLQTAPIDSVCAELKELVKNYPDNEVSEPAGMLVKGLESGRRPGTGGYDIGSLWARRTALSNAAVDEAGKVKALSADRDVPFVCLMAFPTDSIRSGQLLYDVAHFNFGGYMVRNFTLSTQEEDSLSQIRIGGFNSYDEAHLYVQDLAQAIRPAQYGGLLRVVIISESNLALLGTTYSFDDYAAFYDRTFAPLKLNPTLPLDEQDLPIEQRYEDEYTPDEPGKSDDQPTETDNDGGEWYTP